MQIKVVFNEITIKAESSSWPYNEWGRHSVSGYIFFTFFYRYNNRRHYYPGRIKQTDVVITNGSNVLFVFTYRLCMHIYVCMIFQRICRKRCLIGLKCAWFHFVLFFFRVGDIRKYKENVIWLFIFILFVCFWLAFARKRRFLVLNKQVSPLTLCFSISRWPWKGKTCLLTRPLSKR